VELGHCCGHMRYLPKPHHGCLHRMPGKSASHLLRRLQSCMVILLRPNFSHHFSCPSSLLTPRSLRRGVCNHAFHFHCIRCTHCQLPLFFSTPHSLFLTVAGSRTAMSALSVTASGTFRSTARNGGARSAAAAHEVRPPPAAVSHERRRRLAFCWHDCFHVTLYFSLQPRSPFSVFPSLSSLARSLWLKAATPQPSTAAPCFCI
jgi:hypothetical protein